MTQCNAVTSVTAGDTHVITYSIDDELAHAHAHVHVFPTSGASEQMKCPASATSTDSTEAALQGISCCNVVFVVLLAIHP